MSENKIIKFPVDKVKKNKSKVEAQNKMAKSSGKIKKGVPVTLFFIMCLYVVNNHLMMSHHEVRTIASDDHSRDTAWEHRLARQLAEKSHKRGIASVGKSPILQDELTAGFLHNKYRVQFSNGKIINIELAETMGHIEPKYVNSKDFLNSYGSLLPFTYASFKPLGTEKSHEKIIERYSLLDSEERISGEVYFELDLYGRLLAMKVQKAS